MFSCSFVCLLVCLWVGVCAQIHQQQHIRWQNKFQHNQIRHSNPNSLLPTHKRAKNNIGIVKCDALRILFKQWISVNLLLCSKIFFTHPQFFVAQVILCKLNLSEKNPLTFTQTQCILCVSRYKKRNLLNKVPITCKINTSRINYVTIKSTIHH